MRKRHERFKGKDESDGTSHGGRSDANGERLPCARIVGIGCKNVDRSLHEDALDRIAFRVESRTNPGMGMPGLRGARMLRISQLAMVLGIVIGSFDAKSSSVVYETIEEQTRGSAIVVRAIVLQSHALWEPGLTGIWTWTELEVIDPLKGAPGRSILVKQPGGIIGNVGQHVSGTAEFVVGEECILFLERALDAPQTFIVRGLASGKISFEGRTGIQTAVRRTGELRLVRRTPSIDVMPSGSSDALGRVEEIAQRIRRAAGATNR